MSKKLHSFSKESMDFLGRCSSIVAAHHADMFNQHIWSLWQDHDITSPIEHYLHAAIQTATHVLFLDDLRNEMVDGKMWRVGFDVLPQYQIDRYRVDFLVRYTDEPIQDSSGEYTQGKREVIVECDSQAFHERTEQERRYEKARDRHLQRAGYKVFRYTGKEILEDPFRIAAEVISHVGTTETVSEILASIREYERG